MLVTIHDIESLKGYGANLQRIHAYWLAKRGGRPMPRRANLDPTEIPPRLLPGIMLVDVVPDHRRYVYRLVGTMETEVRGYDPPGKSVGEAYFGENAEDATACYDRVVETRAPVFDPLPFLERRRGYPPCRRVDEADCRHAAFCAEPMIRAFRRPVSAKSDLPKMASGPQR